MSSTDYAISSNLETRFFESINRAGIKYCHWKSNYFLSDSLLGRADYDLLVPKESASRFEGILGEMRFQLVEEPSWVAYPSLRHYYGFDAMSGKIIHLHIYYALITGGALFKNYRLPLEKVMTENVSYVENIAIPARGAELLVFVLRKMLEHSSLLEYVLLRREYDALQRELEWLYDPASEAEAIKLLREWMPPVDVGVFVASLRALASKSSFWRRLWLGLRLRASLRPYSIHSPLKAAVWRNYRLLRMLWLRYVLRGGSCSMPKGGVVIAFVGPEASGKSTLLAEAAEWLGQHFSVARVHAGKPPSSWLSLVPNLFLPLLRRVFRELRTNTIEIESSEREKEASVKKRRGSILYVIRSLLIALDQKNVLVRAYRRASRGVIVFCDRYPSATFGGMDGPRVDPESFSSRYSGRRFLARMEQKLYRQIPRPDLVFLLSVPLEIALQRNTTRVKESGTESDMYVRGRHNLMDKWHIPNALVYRIATDRPLEETLLTVKRAIWDAI